MKRVFFDTVGFPAVWNTRDQWHVQAAQTFEELKAAGADFYTTEYILLECGNAASRTPFRADVVEVRNEFLSDGKLIVPTIEDCAAAWAAYARQNAGQAGIVDQVSFIVMRRLGIVDVFGNDRHFRAAGFNTLF
jgi:predicted nucleic acid-binding protein